MAFYAKRYKAEKLEDLFLNVMFLRGTMSKEQHTKVQALKDLNLLGVQFAICEASKYIFYLQYESGSIYRPSTRDFELQVAEPSDSDLRRLAAIWVVWEKGEKDDVNEEAIVDQELHPDSVSGLG